MAKTKVSQFDATASNNTDINSVNVAEGCPPSGINNAIREMASLLKKQEVGTDAMTSPDIDGGTIDGATIGASSASTGAFTTISASGNVDLNGDLDVDGAITSSAGMTITTADNTNQLTLLSTDADANVGPNLNLYRNSGSPADNDVLGLIIYNGRNDNSQDVIYARQLSYIKDVADGQESGQLTLQTMVAGTIRDRLNINPTEIVLNEDSQDLDFRVESNGNANMLFVDGGNNAVGIGTATPASSWVSANNLVISDTSSDGGMTILSGTSGNGNIMFSDAQSGAFGDARGLISYLHASDAMRFMTANAERCRIDNNGKILVNSTNATTGGFAPQMLIKQGADSGFINGLNIEGQTADTVLGLGYNSTSGAFEIASSYRASAGYKPLDFATNGATRMRLTTGGDLGINQSTPSAKLDIIQNGNTQFIAEFHQSHTSGYGLQVNSASSNLIFFYKAGSSIGNITESGGGVSYGTSSDYRLKENVTYDFDATTRLKQLKPSRFNFKANSNITLDGFIAHEVSSIVPEAITGEKDAVDSDGNIIPQNIDQSKLVPLLVKTIQELEARITTLEGA